MRNKYPSEIETPLDRRAMTIDILAGEIERKNNTIIAWRKKVEDLHGRINELEEEVLMVEEKLKLLKEKSSELKKLKKFNFYSSRLTGGTAKKKRSSNNGKVNGNLEDKH